MSDTDRLAALLDRLDAEVWADTDSGSWRNGAQYVIDEVRALASTPLSSGRANLGGSGDGYGTNAATDGYSADGGNLRGGGPVHRHLVNCYVAECWLPVHECATYAPTPPDALDCGCIADENQTLWTCDKHSVAPTPPDALREAALAVVDAWTDDESGMETFDPEVIDRLAAALEPKP